MQCVLQVSLIFRDSDVALKCFLLLLSHCELVQSTVTFSDTATPLWPTAAHVSVVDALAQSAFRLITALREVKLLVESVHWSTAAGLASAAHLSTMASAVWLTMIEIFRGASAKCIQQSPTNVGLLSKNYFSTNLKLALKLRCLKSTKVSN